ncbi:MAG: hypothetical protein IMZ64_11030 [Bacteroidetes bacterium]|nr:hypothetical protein [Bacteroidota bacterium]
MTHMTKSEYNFDEFLKTFLFPETGLEERESTPFEDGILISQNILAIMNKSIKESLSNSQGKKE